MTYSILLLEIFENVSINVLLSTSSESMFRFSQIFRFRTFRDAHFWFIMLNKTPFTLRTELFLSLFYTESICTVRKGSAYRSMPFTILNITFDMVYILKKA